MSGPSPVLADGLIVHDGATLAVHDATVELNCLDLTLESGATFDFQSGSVTSMGNLVVDTGAAVENTGGVIYTCGGSSPPSAATGSATAVGVTGVTLNGLVNANDADTTVAFEFGLTTDYGGSITADQSPVTGALDTAVTAAMTGLPSGTTYHYRVVAQSAIGTTYGGDRTVTTLDAFAPTAATQAATSVGDTTATLGGLVNANGADAVVYFQCGTDTGYGTTVTADQSPVTGTDDTTVSAPITGLTGGTTYHYRVVAENDYGTTYGDDASFTPGPAAPTVTTDAATDVTVSGATLNAIVNPGGIEATVTFEYGSDTSDDYSLYADQNPVAGSTDTAVTLSLSDLSANTTYHYRAVATSHGGTTYGDALTFTTLAYPAVTTEAATVSGTNATLNGTVSNFGYETGVVFEYGTTTGYGTTVSGSIGTIPSSVNGTFSESASLSGLDDNTMYHYRIVATNAIGTAYGDDVTFTVGTVGTPPTAVTGTASGIGTAGATLNATVNAGNADTTVTFEYGGDTAYGSTATAVQSPVSGTADTSASTLLAELEPGTTYHYRVCATNANGTVYGGDMAFTTLPLAPDAVTDTVSDVDTTTATLNGTINANGDSTTVTFEYGATTAYGSTVAAGQSPVTGTADTAVSAAITGLTSGATYHYRVVASNSGGTTTGGDRTFTAGTLAPTAVTSAATGVTTTAAGLNGTVNANGSTTTVAFEYGFTDEYDRIVAASPREVTGSGETGVSTVLAALTPDMTYHYQVVAENEGGIACGGDQYFTTGAGPAVTTEAASGVDLYGATLNATVNANGDSTAVSFEYGTSIAYGNTVTPSSETVTGNSDTPVAAGISGLSPSTTYHYRAVGQNSGGTTYGVDRTFITGAANPDAPEATTNSPSSVSATGATLSGTVNSKNHSTVVTFEYGPDTTYGTTVTADLSPIQYDYSIGVSTAISGLTNGNTYHYRVVATSEYGTSYGSDVTFVATTTSTPTVSTESVTDLGLTSVTLNGTINASNSAVIYIYFQYGTTSSYGTQALASPSSASGITDTPVLLSLSGLSENTTYHYRVYTMSINGSWVFTYGDDMTFTTPSSPTAVTDAATSVQSTSATVNGTVNATGDSTEVTFEYGKSADYGKSVTADQSPVTGASDTAVSADLALLSPNTTYHYRVAASKAGTTVYGDDMTLTTASLAPVATTGAATAIGSDSATVNGTVNANGADTTVTFQYGETTAYGSTAAADQSPVTGTDDTAVSTAVAGLTGSTTYHYRMVAASAAGTVYGADRTLITNPTGTPVVTTVGADNVDEDSAECEGNVTDEGGASVTARGICWATAPLPTIADSVTSEGSGTGAFTGELTGLSPFTAYYVRAWATNANGTAYGNSITFSTGLAPNAVTGGATDIGTDTVTLNGTVDTYTSSATVTFEYGETTAYGDTVTADQSPLVSDSDTAISAGVRLLSQGTLYHYRAVARNGWATAYGADRVFMTDGGGDRDGDGLSDFDEVNTYGTDYLESDSDGDGLSDGTEVNSGLDPLSAQGPGIPALVHPGTGESQIDLSTPLEVAYGSNATADGHGNTRWQIARDTGFSSLAMDITSENHLLSLTVPALVLDGDTTYYWRVRFTGTDALDRTWSETGSFSTTPDDRGDGNANGLPDDQELAGDDTGDFDPGTEAGWQDTLSYLAFDAEDGTSAQTALRLSDDGSSLLFFSHAPASDISDTPPSDLDMGLFSIKIEVPAPGDTTRVRLYFSPSPLDEDSQVYKYDTVTGWFDYTGYIELADDLALFTIELVDGGYGDADGVANGIIVDPLGTSTANDDSGETSLNGSSGSDGGGCFIDGLKDEKKFGGYLFGFLVLVAGMAMPCTPRRNRLRKK